MRQHKTKYSFDCTKFLGSMVVEGYLQGKMNPVCRYLHEIHFKYEGCLEKSPQICLKIQQQTRGQYIVLNKFVWWISSAVKKWQMKDRVICEMYWNQTQEVYDWCSRGKFTGKMKMKKGHGRSWGESLQ